MLGNLVELQSDLTQSSLERSSATKKIAAIFYVVLQLLLQLKIFNHAHEQIKGIMAIYFPSLYEHTFIFQL